MQTLPKFSSLTYERPDFAAWQRDVDALTQEAQAAGSVQDLLAVIRKMNDLNARNNLQSSLAFIRCYLDSSDPFYAQETQACDRGGALLDDTPLLRAILASPYAPELDGAMGPNLRHILEDRVKLTANAKDLQAKEAELVNQYQQKKATLRIPFRGKDLSEGEINTLLMDPDRPTRLEAAQALHTAYAQQADTFQDLLSQLVEVRNAIARANGFDRYMDFANLAKGRRAYGQKELLDFCRQVREDLVPLQEKLARDQAQRLGLETLTFSVDTALTFPDGNAKPVGDGPVLLEAGKGMYDAISPETARLYRAMVEGGYIDVTSSPNKISNMGFCTLLAPLKIPYIFGNCDGSIHDASTLTHEFGHAYQMWLSMTHQPVDQYFDMPNDVVEIPSKAMEQFTAPYAKLFFGDTWEKFAYHHMKYTVDEICAFCATHVYETWLYDHPQATARERIDAFNETMRAYGPGLDYGPLAGQLTAGSALYRSMGVYMFPAYVISYALSDMGALEFRERAQADFPAAWESYRALCMAGGSQDYDQLMATAGLSTAYAPGAARRAARTAARALGVSL